MPKYDRRPSNAMRTRDDWEEGTTLYVDTSEGWQIRNDVLDARYPKPAEWVGSGDFREQGSGEIGRGLIAFAAPHGLLWRDHKV